MSEAADAGAGFEQERADAPATPDVAPGREAHKEARRRLREYDFRGVWPTEVRAVGIWLGER